MPEHDNVMSLKTLAEGLQQTVLRVNDTKEPIFVAIKGRPGVAIVDLDEYRELIRLADIGLMVELNEEVKCEEAEGTLVPWSVVIQELMEIIEEQKRLEDG
jgi:PHD/YefM family antitoxin component YafN of YafNO toxin-antitoxin module